MNLGPVTAPPSPILRPLAIPKENSAQGPCMPVTCHITRAPMSELLVMEADWLGRRRPSWSITLWPHTSPFSFPSQDDSETFKSPKCLGLLQIVLKNAFLHFSAVWTFPPSLQFPSNHQESRRKKSSTCQPNITDDLITSCSNIFWVPTFSPISPPADCAVTGFLAGFRTLPRPTRSLSPSAIVKENFSIQIGRKKTPHQHVQMLVTVAGSTFV